MFAVGVIFWRMFVGLKIAWMRLSKTENISNEDERTVLGYKVRDRVMNDSESAFFHALVRELPQNYFIFPKMRIADILETMGGYGYIYRRNKILPKHIDFLICNEFFAPLLAIELDGKSHEAQDRIERDVLVNEIFASTNLKLERVSVGSDFKTLAVEIQKKLNLVS